jgi:hypothetical protein
MISDFDSKIWIDPWFEKLSFTERMLFIYLWTNSHKNVAGLYSIGLRTISFETGIAQNKLEALLKALFPKVYYDFDKEIVWVVNHVKHQFYKSGKISPKIVVHIVKNLLAQNPHPFVEHFFGYYPFIQDTLKGKIDNLDIGYRYYIPHSGYSPGEGTDAGAGKGEGAG